jgi:predicted dienelactone hydrolase
MYSGHRHISWPAKWPALLAAVLLAACAQPHRPPPDDKPKFVRGHGYTAERRFATASLHETWEDRDGVIDVELLAPASAGRFPLIVYLPGLGEAANAGSQWRNAWAEAGYVVLSMQPTRFGPAVLSSSQARSGDFRALAREEFSTPALEQRLHALADVIAEATKRSRSNTRLFASIDLDRVAVAGFDLGAQTGMAVAGELTGTATEPGRVRAVIALSPYVNLAAGALAQRFSAISTPVLTVTGTDDGDAYGVVGSAALRRAPWQHMAAGDKFLLLLEGGTHKTLAGNASGDFGEKNPNGTNNRPSRPDGGTEQRNLGADILQNLDQTDPAGSGRHRDRSGSGKRGGDKREGEMAQSTNPMHVAYVQTVSTAFLDAIVKNDPIAREWLYRDATRWLADDAEFRIK